MRTAWRTILVISGGFMAWVFWFIPNPLFHFLNVYGLDTRLSALALFGAIPIMLGALVALLLASGLRYAVIATIALPTLGVVTCFLLWLGGHYSDEGLFGAWLISLPPIPAYVAGVLVGMWLRMRLKLTTAR